MNILKQSMTVALLAGCFLDMPVLRRIKRRGTKIGNLRGFCHGAGGKSSNDQFPILAGQQPTISLIN